MRREARGGWQLSACAARACEAPLRRGCAQHYVRGSAAQGGGRLRGWARAQEGEGSTGWARGASPSCVCPNRGCAAWAEPGESRPINTWGP